MPKTIDLSQKLDNTKPLIKIADGKIYEVDNRLEKVLKVDKHIKTVAEGDLNAMNEIIEILLGKEAAKEIKAMDLTLPAYERLIAGLMAAVSDEDFDTVYARFQREKQKV